MALITLKCKERVKKRRELVWERERSPAQKDKWSWQDSPKLEKLFFGLLISTFCSDSLLKIPLMNFSFKASEHLVLPPLNLSALWSSFPLQGSSVSSLHSPLLYTLSLSLSQQLEKGNTPAGLLLKEVMTLYEENLLKSSSFFPFLFTKTDDRFSLACPG